MAVSLSWVQLWRRPVTRLLELTATGSSVTSEYGETYRATCRLKYGVIYKVKYTGSAQIIDVNKRQLTILAPKLRNCRKINETSLKFLLSL